MTTATPAVKFIRPGIDFDAFEEYLESVIAADEAANAVMPLPDVRDLDRWLELAHWSIDTGQRLPMPATTIMELEDVGYLVDLETGAIEQGAPPRGMYAVASYGAGKTKPARNGVVG